MRLNTTLPLLLAAVALATLTTAAAQTHRAVDFAYDADSLMAFAHGPDGEVYALLHPRYRRDQLYRLGRDGGVTAEPHLEGAFELLPDDYPKPIMTSLAAWPGDRRRIITGRMGHAPGAQQSDSLGFEVVIADRGGRLDGLSVMGYYAYQASSLATSSVRVDGDRAAYQFYNGFYFNGAVFNFYEFDFARGHSLGLVYRPTPGNGAYYTYRGDIGGARDYATISAGVFSSYPNSFSFGFRDTTMIRGGVTSSGASLDDYSTSSTTFAVCGIRFVDDARAIAVGAHREEGWIAAWMGDRHTPWPARAAATTIRIGLPRAGYHVEGAVAVDGGREEGAVYLAYIAVDAASVRTLSVRRLGFGDEATTLVYEGSADGITAVTKLVNDGGDLLVHYERLGGAAGFRYLAPVATGPPAVSFPAGVPAELCFGESLLVEVDYRDAPPGTTVVYDFGCGVTSLRDRPVLDVDSIRASCELAPGECRETELVVAAVRRGDTTVVARRAVRVCGTRVARDTIIVCQATGPTTRAQPERFRDSVAVADDCSVTRLLTVRQPAPYAYGFRAPCDTTGQAARYDSLWNPGNRPFAYDADGGPGGCPLTVTLNDPDDDVIAIDLGADTFLVRTEVTIPESEVAGVEYVWYHESDTRSGRTQVLRFPGNWRITASTPAGCSVFRDIYVDDGYEPLGRELAGASAFDPAAAQVSLCGGDAFHSDAYASESPSSYPVCNDPSDYAAARWYSFRTDDSGTLSFVVTAGDWADFDPLQVSIFEQRVGGEGAREHLLTRTCEWYFAPTSFLYRFRREITIEEVRPNTVHWLRVAHEALAHDRSGARFSVSEIEGIAGADATPPAPTVSLATGEDGVVEEGSCELRLDVAFDTALADYVELEIAGQPIRVNEPGTQTVTVPGLRNQAAGTCETYRLTARALAGCAASAPAAGELPEVTVCRPAAVRIDTNLCYAWSILLDGASVGRDDRTGPSTQEEYVPAVTACAPDTVYVLQWSEPLWFRPVDYNHQRCLGDTITLAIRANGRDRAGDFVYAWAQNGRALDVSGLRYVPVDTGLIIVTATDAEGCSAEVSVRVEDCTTPLVRTNGLEVTVWLPGGVRYDSVAWYVEGERVARGGPAAVSRHVLRGGDTLVYTLAAAGTYDIEALGYLGEAAPVRYFASVTVGTSDLAAVPRARPRLTAFPNPAAARLRYRLSEVPAGADVEIVAYDPIGRVVYRARGLPEGELDASTWAAGVYLLEARGSSGTARTRVVKRR